MGLVQKALGYVDRFLVRFMKSIIIVVTLMAIGTMFVQVVARYIFEIPIVGLDELAGHTADSARRGTQHRL